MSTNSVNSRFSIRGVAATTLAVVLVWYLFFSGSAGDNNVFHGIEVLAKGIWNLPGLVFDGTAYSNFWKFIRPPEGTDSQDLRIGEHVVDHVQLVMTSMFWASLISIGLGILTHRVKILQGPVLAIASILLTIPSLALFAIFISVPGIGIGDRGPILALVLYSVLPILRNTITGLESVDSAVIESARGMGLGVSQRLVKVELPLAWPIILTGLRVATLLNIGIAAIAVLVGGTGLGAYINDGLQRFPNVTSVERIWLGVILCIVLALLFDFAFAVIRKLTISKGLR